MEIAIRAIAGLGAFQGPVRYGWGEAALEVDRQLHYCIVDPTGATSETTGDSYHNSGSNRGSRLSH